MPRNIEIKARIDSVEALLPTALTLADGPAELIVQDDTFFAVPIGRLKLREFADGSAELIHYHRPDTQAAKASVHAPRPRGRCGVREKPAWTLAVRSLPAGASAP